MARPSSNGDSCTSPYFDPDFLSSSSRKRARGVSDDNLSINCSEDTHKTRRVNPQRLATRLGPDLVAEMEALIVPGAKMPTFEVRKVFQEKYSVDRRHIYDYFHSRGLRVAKEDKHTNLTRGRLAKALQKEMQEAQMQAKEILEEAPPKNAADNDASLIVSPKPPLASKLFFQSSLSRGYENGISATKLRSRLEAFRFAPCRPSPRRFCPSSPPEIDDSLDVASELPCPEFTMLEEESRPLMDDLLGDLPSGILGVDEVVADFSIDLHFDRSNPDALLSVNERRPLTETERTALYNLINDNTEPTEGIAECVGTYHAYMEERSRLYFDRLFFKGACRKPEVSGESSARMSGNNYSFKKWLSDPVRQEGTADDADFAKRSLVSVGESYLVTLGMDFSNSPWSIGPEKSEVTPLVISNAEQHEESSEARPGEVIGPLTRQSYHDVSHIEGHGPLQPTESQAADPHAAGDRVTPTLHSFGNQQPTQIKRYQTLKSCLSSSNTLVAQKIVRLAVHSTGEKVESPHFTNSDANSPDCHGVLRNPLFHPKPSRLRTASAGGGM